MSAISRQIRKSVNRLLKLSAFLYTLQKVDFDMSLYSRPKDDDDLSYRQKPLPVHCKTVCCIGGWATRFHPSLRLTQHGFLTLPVGEMSSWCGHAAFARAFDLPFDVASQLCETGAPHQTPKQAAKAVEKVATELAADHGFDVVEG